MSAHCKSHSHMFLISQLSLLTLSVPLKEPILPHVSVIFHSPLGVLVKCPCFSEVLPDSCFVFSPSHLKTRMVPFFGFLNHNLLEHSPHCTLLMCQVPQREDALLEARSVPLFMFLSLVTHI